MEEKKEEIKKKEVNENLLQITGKCCLPRPLEIDKDYILAIQTNCYSVSEVSNQNGTVNKKYKCKLIGEAHIQNESGQRMKIETKQSQSQRLRTQIMMTNESERDDETEYQYQMTLIRHFYPRIKKIMQQWKDRGE